MTRKTIEVVQCNGCFKEERCAESRTGFGIVQDGLPAKWVTVLTSDRNTLWDLCGDCHKEIAVLLFAKERIDRVLEKNCSEAQQ